MSEHPKNLRELSTTERDAFFYTHPVEALEVLSRRREEGVHREIEKALPLESGTLSNFLNSQGPVGITYRDVTPNFEQHRFISICDLMGLTPLIFENPHDKFVARNRSKYLLAKMVFFEGYGKKGGAKTKNIKIVDFAGAEGRMLCDVPTESGGTLSSFHKELFFAKYPDLESRVHHVKNLCDKLGVKDIYERLFSLSISHGIFLERFLWDSDEASFTQEVAWPAFLNVWEKFGKKPLIVPFQPTGCEESDFWYQYPQDVFPMVFEKINYNNHNE